MHLARRARRLCFAVVLSHGRLVGREQDGCWPAQDELFPASYKVSSLSLAPNFQRTICTFCVSISMAEAQSSPRAPAASAAPAPVSHQVPTEPLPEDDELEIDDSDSAYGTSLYSDSQSLTSSIAKGYIEHGRRYQSTKEDTIAFPSDDKQYESMGANHLVFLILESQQKNPLFRSPISEKAQHILDLGTGNGAWPIDVADRFTQSKFILPTNRPLCVEN